MTRLILADPKYKDNHRLNVNVDEIGKVIHKPLRDINALLQQYSSLRMGDNSYGTSLIIVGDLATTYEQCIFKSRDSVYSRLFSVMIATQVTRNRLDADRACLIFLPDILSA